jgi:hypothetical protein
MPIGSKAQYAAITGISTLGVGLNYDNHWTSSVVITTTTDPLVHVLVDASLWPNNNWNFLTNGGKNCGNTAADEALIRSYVASSTAVYPANPWSTISTPDSSQWLSPSFYHRADQDFASTTHLRVGACPSPDTDGLMAVFQPNGWVLDTYATIVMSNGDIVGQDVASYIDAKGDGTGWWNGRRASMIPSFAGLIRIGEISNGKIPHAISIIMSPTMLTQQAAWPAYSFDRNSGYSGTLPMGSLLAIPPSVDISSLGLTASGKVLAKALQDYGAYIVDRGGPGGFVFLAELNNPEIRWDNWRNDVTIVGHTLQLVLNNSAKTPGGGGTPRVPLAPPFYDDASEPIRPAAPCSSSAHRHCGREQSE